MPHLRPKITTLIFDCFGVISDQVLGSWYRINSQKYGFTDDNLPKVFEKFDLGEYSEDDIIDYFLKYKGVNSTKEKLREEIDGYLKLNNLLFSFIKKLKSKGYKLVLLSNANSAFFTRKVFPTYPEIKEVFDEVIISSDIGMIKPNEDIYKYALNKIHSRPEETLFVDDGKNNVDAAQKIGMQGYIYTDFKSFKEHITMFGIEVVNK